MHTTHTTKTKTTHRHRRAKQQNTHTHTSHTHSTTNDNGLVAVVRVVVVAHKIVVGGLRMAVSPSVDPSDGAESLASTFAQSG